MSSWEGNLLLSDFKAFSWFTYNSNFPPTLFLEFCVMDSICGVDEVCCVATHYLEKCGCGKWWTWQQLMLPRKGIFCSLILKPYRELPIRVTSRQLYFFNFVLWPAFVVLMRYVVFPLITLKSKGVGMANLTTTQNVFLRREFSALWF